MNHSLRPGEYMRRLLRARAFLIKAEADAFERIKEAQEGVGLVRQELASLDRQIMALNGNGGAA
jgi:hypothetical protein